MKESRVTPVSLPVRPYRRWDSFDFGDSAIFFGRDHECSVLHSEILSSRLVVLYARSGTGKTSLINAGVRPMLEDDGFRTRLIRMGTDPLTSLKDATRDLDPPAWENANRQRLAPYFRTMLPASANPVVLFLDQFEEFFIRFTSDVQSAFIEEIAEVIHDPELGVFLVFSLREDFFVELDAFRRQVPTIYHNNSNLRLRALSPGASRLAIVEPARLFGAEFAPDLVDELVAGLAGEGGLIEPIRLQVVCDALWEASGAKGPAGLDVELYRRLGGIEAIERRVFTEALDRLAATEIGARLPDLLRSLITTVGTKNYRELDGLRESLRMDQTALDAVLKPLEENRLVRASLRDQKTFYELTHDSLVPQVQRWLSADRQEVKEALALLRSAYESWRVARRPIARATFDRIHQRRALIEFGDGQKHMMAQAAIAYGEGVSHWLQRLDSAQATLELIDDLLKGKPAPELQKNCLAALIQVRQKGAAQRIVELALTGEASVRDRAQAVLAERASPSDFEELLQMVENDAPDRTRRHAAAQVLGRMRRAGRTLPRGHAEVYGAMVWDSSLLGGPSTMIGRALRAYELACARGLPTSSTPPVAASTRLWTRWLWVMALAFSRSAASSVPVAAAGGAISGLFCALLVAALGWLLRLVGLDMAGPALLRSIARWDVPWSLFAGWGMLIAGAAGALPSIESLGRVRAAMRLLKQPAMDSSARRN